MPRIGTPSEKIAGSQWGAPGSYTLFGPPERIKASGSSSRTRSAVMSCRTIRANACRSRTRRAMSCTYWAPKSRTSTGRDAGPVSAMCRLIVIRE